MVVDPHGTAFINIHLSVQQLGQWGLGLHNGLAKGGLVGDPEDVVLA